MIKLMGGPRDKDTLPLTTPGIAYIFSYRTLSGFVCVRYKRVSNEVALYDGATSYIFPIEDGEEEQ